jgi:subtilase family serine protease
MFTRTPMLSIAARTAMRLSLFLSAHAVAALAAAPADRIVSAPESGQRVALNASRAAWASPANDVGAVADDLWLGHLAISLTRSPERQRAFEQLLADQQDPSSPAYHHWLSPREVGQRFGATEHDIGVIADWLRARGLAVDSISNGRTRIRFSGPAAAVGAAFATSLRYYRVGGEKRIGYATSVRIPAAFAGVVASVTGLESVRYRPALHVSGPIRSLAPSSRPAGTYCPGGVAPCQYTIFPADFDAIYDLDPVRQQGTDGTGQTIVIVGRSRIYAPDIDHFRSLAGLTGAAPTTIVPPDGTDPGAPLSTCPDDSTPTCGNPADQVGDQSEATLDVERATSVAPGAAIALVVSADTNSIDGINFAIDYAVDHDPVPGKILSISFTSCEADNSLAVARSLDDVFGQAAAEGISVFVASGDAGVAGCASLDAAPAPGEPSSTNIICSSQYVTCAGGTEFADADDESAYWQGSNGPYFLSAIGYIPEGGWNEPLDRNGNTQLAASGGGVSSYLPKPAWQTGIGVPGSAGRYTPDVSLHASTREGYFTCVAAQGGSCVVESGTFSFIASGGTSASAPGLAGIAALLDERTGSAQGNLNPRLYSLAAEAGAAAFHDVTLASSGVAGCTLALPSLCNNSTPGPSGLTGGLAGFLVGAGYDEVTGLGSVDAANLIARWTGASATVDPDQFGLTGAWYNPATSGQGVVLQIVPDYYGNGIGLAFAGWFTFDVLAAGGQRWYSVQGQVSSSQASTTLPVYVSEGGNFAAPPNVGVASAGQATLGFSDCSHGSLTYALDDGRSGSIPLTRLGSNVACSSNGSTHASGPYLLSGAWYDPATSGQGFLFDVDPAQHSLFAAWYTYATDGQQIGGGASQRWYSLQATFTPGVGTFSNVPIYATTGGAFDDPTSVTTTQVGTAIIAFHDCNSATLTYAFDAGTNGGRSGTIPLVRTSPALSGCSL